MTVLDMAVDMVMVSALIGWQLPRDVKVTHRQAIESAWQPASHNGLRPRCFAALQGMHLLMERASCLLCGWPCLRRADGPVVHAADSAAFAGDSAF